MAHVDDQIELVSNALKLVLPDMRSVAIAAACIGRDEQLAGFWVSLLADLLPPRLDRCDREDRGIVIDADADKSVVGGEVVDTVGDGFADRITGEIVNVDELRLILGLPLASAVLEIADKLLLLGIDRNYRDIAVNTVLSFGVDVLELRIAVRVLRALDGLGGRLEAVTVLSLIRMPCCLNSSPDNTTVLLHVQRSGDSGSPRVTGSTSFSSAGQTSGCSIS
jgi:hypothetical protein